MLKCTSVKGSTSFLFEICRSCLSLLLPVGVPRFTWCLKEDTRSPFELVHGAVSPGVCVVDGPHGGARRKLPVPLRHRHGRRSGDPVPRELGQLPAFPAAQRLPPSGL